MLLLAGLAGSFSLHADDFVATTNRPAITVPPALATNHPAAIASSRTDLPTITPNGLMTLFGKKQALFKVTSADAASAETSYCLSEGEGREGVRVVAIDPETDSVTFDNHGVVQKISLKPAASSIAPAVMQQTSPPSTVVGGGTVVPSRFTPRDFAGGVVVADFTRRGSPAVGFKHSNRFQAGNSSGENAGTYLFPPPGIFPGQPSQPDQFTAAPMPVVQNVLRLQPDRVNPPAGLQYQPPIPPNYTPPQGSGNGAVIQGSGYPR